MSDNNIIESIGSWGVKTTSHKLAHLRFQTVKSGDIVDFSEYEGTYPYTKGRWGRVQFVDKENGKVGFCCHMGSAFLNESGTVSISGGPFESADIDELVPTFSLKVGLYWNWGDNYPGGDQGVNYRFPRPVFKLVKHE